MWWTLVPKSWNGTDLNSSMVWCNEQEFRVTEKRWCLDISSLPVSSHWEKEWQWWRWQLLVTEYLLWATHLMWVIFIFTNSVGSVLLLPLHFSENGNWGCTIRRNCCQSLRTSEATCFGKDFSILCSWVSFLKKICNNECVWLVQISIAVLGIFALPRGTQNLLVAACGI